MSRARTITIVCLALGAAALRAQEPPKKPEPSKETAAEISKNVALVKDDKKWVGAMKRLVQLAREGHDEAIMLAMGELWRSTEDESVHERFYVVMGQISRYDAAVERRERLAEGIAEIEEKIRAVRAAADNLGADDPAAKAMRDAVGSLESALRRFRQSLKRLVEMDGDLNPASDEPVDLPIGEEDLPIGEEVPAEPAPKPGSEPKKEPAPGKDIPRDAAGDRARIEWIRPFAKAREEARRLGRPLLVKPIMGGSNTPDPYGVPCGGVNDCEGSW